MDGSGVAAPPSGPWPVHVSTRGWARRCPAASRRCPERMRRRPCAEQRLAAEQELVFFPRYGGGFGGERTRVGSLPLHPFFVHARDIRVSVFCPDRNPSFAFLFCGFFLPDLDLHHRPTGFDTIVEIQRPLTVDHRVQTLLFGMNK
jgi:hypothetical protein